MPLSSRIKDASTADERTWIEHGIASDFGMVSDDRSEFFETCARRAFSGRDTDFTAIEAHVGENYAGTQVASVTHNGITHVVEVWDLRLIKNDGVLELAGVAQDASGADDHILSDITSTADFAVFPDPRRPLDHGSLLDDCAASDEHSAADERFPDHSAVNGRL